MTIARRIFFACCAVVFLCSYPLILLVNNPNENVRTYMTMAIVEEHTLRIDGMVARHGWVNDMARAPSKAEPDAFHYFSVKAPAVSFAGVPVYWVFKTLAPHFGHPIPTIASTPVERDWWLRAATFTLRIFVVQIPCLLFLVWFERWLRQTTRDPVLRLSAVAAAGLGTNYVAYSLMFVSHALFAVAAFVSFGVTTTAWLQRREAIARPKWSAFVAGFCAGWATLLEYHALPVSILLTLYAIFVFYRPSRLALFALGGSIHAALLMLFQWRAFGSPFTPGHKMVESQVFAEQHHHGIFGVSAPKLDILGELTLSRTFGFFGTSSFMWLGLLAVPFALVFTIGPRARVRRTAAAVWIFTMLTLFVTVSGVQNWHGGWSVGPRYYGCAPPFFAFGAVCALEWFGQKHRAVRTIVRALAGGLAVASVAQSGIVSILYNTLPEDITRPLPQFAIPALIAGFVPRHPGELIGLPQYWMFYPVVACLLAAPLVAALQPAKDRWFAYSARVLMFFGFAAVGVSPAFAPLLPTEPSDGSTAVRWLTSVWEPHGRDRISVLREEAERFGPRRPCLWVKLAATERRVGWIEDAVRDEARAGSIDRNTCK